MKRIKSKNELVDGEVYYIFSGGEYDSVPINVGVWRVEREEFDIYGPGCDFEEDDVVILYSEYLEFIKNNLL